MKLTLMSVVLPSVNTCSTLSQISTDYYTVYCLTEEGAF